MTRARGQKVDLFKWVNDQQALDMRTKFILRELAGYADGNCVAWCKVETLAYAANCTERTVFNHLATLRDAGLIVDTGRTHRLDDSTRSVPLWQLAPNEPGLGQPWETAASIPEEISPIAAACMQSGGGIHETGFHPVGHKGLQESSDELSPSAGEREALFGKVIEACPRSMLKFADRDKARAVFEDLCDQGFEVAELPGCMRRMVVDPAWKSRRFPPQLDVWFAKRHFDGWWPEARADQPVPERGAQAAVEHAAPEADRAIWRTVEAEACAALTETTYGSWIKPASLRAVAGGLYVVAATGTARDWIAGNCWRRIEGWWAQADSAKRPLKLVSRIEFEALAKRQAEGVA